MKIFVIDPKPDSRALLVSRVNEATRRVKIRRVELIDGDFNLVLENAEREPPQVAILGPGSYDELDELVSRFRNFHPKVPLAIVLDNEIYTAEALELRRFVSCRIMPLADIAQLAQFFLDGSGHSSSALAKSFGVVGVVQMKGGVGATSVAAALAGCYAEHRLRTVLVDLDDFGVHLTDWARIGLQQRRLVAECLTNGKLPDHRLREALKEIEGYEHRLAVLGLPEQYQECFHLKADILDDAPSSAEYVESMVQTLREQCDIALIDLGRSWGVAQLATLRVCDKVVLVVDDDRTSLIRTVKNLMRLYRESDDPLEFDFSKWQVVVNAVTGRTLNPHDVADALVDAELFVEPPTTTLIPFSLSGREWSSVALQHPVTLYDVGESLVRAHIEETAHSICPLPRYHGQKRRLSGAVRDGLQRIVTFLS